MTFELSADNSYHKVAGFVETIKELAAKQLEISEALMENQMEMLEQCKTLTDIELLTYFEGETHDRVADVYGEEILHRMDVFAKAMINHK